MPASQRRLIPALERVPSRSGRGNLTDLVKGYLRRFPMVRRIAVRTRTNVQFFFYSARQGLWGSIFSISGRKRSLPSRQDFLKWEVEIEEPEGATQLLDAFHRSGLSTCEGTHTIYLPPQAGLDNLIPEITRFYPPNSGFKILKDLRAPDEASYLIPTAQVQWRRRFIGGPREQVATANYMHSLGIGPRVWDVCCWKIGRVECTVFVMDHVTGPSPTREQHRAFLEKLDSLTQNSFLTVLQPNWREHRDFATPDCNGNLIFSNELGAPQYVDFQNFTIAPPSAWSRKAAHRGSNVFHFGGGRLFRSGRYLYQSIPGLSKGGKRSTERRWAFLAKEFQKMGLDISGRLVLDVGCNAGMVLNSALGIRAGWAMGWDRPEVIDQTRELLMSLGASRFDLIGAELSPKYHLERDVPEHLKPRLHGSVIFYLSVREHIGISASLGRIPWHVLVYEGHQGEGIQDSFKELASLMDENVHVAVSETLADGDSRPRPLVVLQRDLSKHPFSLKQNSES